MDGYEPGSNYWEKKGVKAPLTDEEMLNWSSHQRDEYFNMLHSD